SLFDLPVSILRRHLPAVDEVFELFLVLVRVPVGLVAEHPPLLDEVLERRARVSRGPEAKLSRRLGGRKGSAPSEKVEQLRGEKGRPRLADGERRHAEADGRQQGRMELASGVQQRRERLVAGRGGVVGAAGPAP